MQMRREPNSYGGTSLIFNIDSDYIDITPETVQRYFGGNRYIAGPDTRGKIVAGIDRPKQLAMPAGMIVLHEIDSVRVPQTGRLRLSGGLSIACPNHKRSWTT